MATTAQIFANRLNARKSTGPRTEAGKAASRMNALKHGIDSQTAVLPGEDPAEYEALAAEYSERFKPSTPEQHFLVQTMIQADWNRRRYTRIQNELTARLLDEMDPADRSLAALFLPGNRAGRALNRVIRLYDAAQNAWFRALTQLKRLQQEQAEAVTNLSLSPHPEKWLRSGDPPDGLTPLPPVAPDRDHNLALRL
jgi:hypothetical protein